MNRKCIHAKSGRSAICHGFFQVNNGPDDGGPVAVVEYASGTVDTWNAEMVVFSLDEADKAGRGE